MFFWYFQIVDWSTVPHIIYVWWWNGVGHTCYHEPKTWLLRNYGEHKIEVCHFSPNQFLLKYIYFIFYVISTTFFYEYYKYNLTSKFHTPHQKVSFTPKYIYFICWFTFYQCKIFNLFIYYFIKINFDILLI